MVDTMFTNFAILSMNEIAVVTRTGVNTKEFLKFGRSFVRALQILNSHFSELLGHIFCRTGSCNMQVGL